jgi:hypothetical protein
MKKSVRIIFAVVCISAVIFSGYVLGVKSIARHDAKIADRVLIDIVSKIFNRVNKTGEIKLTLKNADGAINTLVLVPKLAE